MDIFNIDLKNRIFGLDILRAAAILFVLYSHGQPLIAPFVDQKITNMFNLDGVTLFFVLSGFLIGRILLKIYFKEEPLTWKDLWSFWVRRWFRTVPPFFIMLLILMSVGLMKGQFSHISFHNYFLFIQNLWYPHPNFFPEAWSLSVEEWFYLSFPLLLFLGAILLKLRSRAAFLFTVGCFFLLGFSYRTYITLDMMNEGVFIGKIYDLHLRKVVLSRVDSMMFGVLAAYIYYFHKDFWTKHRQASFMLGLVFLYLYKKFPFGHYEFIWGVLSFTMLSIGTFLMLPQLNAIKVGKGIWAKLIVAISVSSYSMYLVNLSFSHMIRAYLPQDTMLLSYFSFALYLFLCFIVSALAYQFIERPILKFRDRLYKKQSI